ncbi:MAG: glutamine--tRNA ligase [Acidiferrobacteraceae bacterium]|nr:glutamine--tRNA ligase [Acidiferrobacteraceae bacterium]
MSDTKHQTNSFIHQIVRKDVGDRENAKSVVTRFPPEPNGYLHIGHAKSMCLNFGIAREFDGVCFLRFDDTNPCKEDEHYVASIKADVEWMGFSYGNHLTHASDYFDQLYEWAIELIKNGKAYVCSLSAEDIRASRGTLKTAGQNSPYRERAIEENMDLFERMRGGEFANGSHVLRAKIDMASPNMNLRDPTLYRIRHQNHQNTGNRWCVYPMYDFTHPLSDAIEGVTHSLCTLEFEDHRPLYDWILNNVSVPCQPQQIEFSRLSLDYTVMSKRLLTSLVENQCVAGWDDPRMPTLSGMRRRGYRPESIRTFCDRVGITKKEQKIELSALEACVREDLEQIAVRRMGVIKPLKVVIENYSADDCEELTVPNHPGNPKMGNRIINFSNEIWIDSDDFMEHPSKNFFRLSPGREVRLRYAYYITCIRAIKNDSGEITELRCRYDPESRGGGTKDNRKVRGTLHWVSAKHALSAVVRLYGPLFTTPDPIGETKGDFMKFVNADSLKTMQNAKLETSIEETIIGDAFQLERIGYFCLDSKSSSENLVLNQTVALRDSKRD